MENNNTDEEEVLFYTENGYVVFTALYHIKRGVCCGSGCRHCPFEPRHAKGNTTISTNAKLDIPDYLFE